VARIFIIKAQDWAFGSFAKGQIGVESGMTHKIKAKTTPSAFPSATLQGSNKICLYDKLDASVYCRYVPDSLH
jgi:hypothetical protein